MARKLLVFAAMALALLLLSSPFDSAEARRGSGGHGHGGHGHGGHAHGGHGHAMGARAHMGGRMHVSGHMRAHKHGVKHAMHHKRRHVRHARKHRFVTFASVYGYAYDGGCDWLRRKAVATDSRTWWRRYRACIAGYDY